MRGFYATSSSFIQSINQSTIDGTKKQNSSTNGIFAYNNYQISQILKSS